MKGWEVNDELERVWKGSGHGLILSCYPSIPLQWLRETTKYLSHDSLSPGRDLNPAEDPEYKARVSTTRPRRLVTNV
jgi:hypothetical protein